MNIDYIMENPNEGDRLERKTDAAASEEQLRQCGLQAGMAALDVGCGTGAVTRVMSRIAAPSRVVGVDQSVARLTQARSLATAADLPTEFTEGDIYSLPFSDGSFDFSWSRFLFQYLQHPADALAELRRVTRPDGTVVVADLDGQFDQIHPLPEPLAGTLRESLLLLAGHGFDPHVGRKLFHMFCAAGFRDIRVHVKPYQVYAGGMPERDLANWRQKLDTSAERLISITGDRKRFESFRDALLAHLLRPDSFYYCSLITLTAKV